MLYSLLSNFLFLRFEYKNCKIEAFKKAGFKSLQQMLLACCIDEFTDKVNTSVHQWPR